MCEYEKIVNVWFCLFGNKRKGKEIDKLLRICAKRDDYKDQIEKKKPIERKVKNSKFKKREGGNNKYTERI